MKKERHRFTAKEQKIIKELAPYTVYSEIAVQLGLDKEQVKRRAYVLGIRIDKDELARRRGLNFRNSRLKK